MTRIHPIYRTHRGLNAEALDLLENVHHAVLGTENSDWSVHLTAVTYLFENGSVYVGTSAASRKARNVSTRPRATILVLDRRIDGAAWVSGSGHAEVMVGEPAQEVNRRIRSRYLTEEGEKHVGAVMSIYDDVTISVVPEKWMSWNMNAMFTTFAEHGLAMDQADDWFIRE